MPRPRTGMSLATATSVTTGTGGTCGDAARALSRLISETMNQPATTRPAIRPTAPTLDRVPLLIRGKLHRRIPLKVHPLLWRLHGYTQPTARGAAAFAEFPQEITIGFASVSCGRQISIASITDGLRCQP